MDCSLSGSSVHGLLQARRLEWVAISLSRRSPWPRDQTSIYVSCIGRWVLYHWRQLGSPLLTWGHFLANFTRLQKLSSNTHHQFVGSTGELFLTGHAQNLKHPWKWNFTRIFCQRGTKISSVLFFFLLPEWAFLAGFWHCRREHVYEMW